MHVATKTTQIRAAAGESRAHIDPSSGFAPYPASVRDDRHGERARRHATARARKRSSRPSRVETITAGPHRQHPQLRQGQLLRALGRPQPHPGVRAPGRAQRARLRGVEAARLRRSHRRRRPSVPHQDQRAVDLGIDARVPRQVLHPAAGEVARPAGRRDPLPPALPRSHRQSGRAARLRDPQPHGRPRSASSSSRAAFSRSRRR